MDSWEIEVSKKLSRGTPFADDDVLENAQKHGWGIAIKGLKIAIEKKSDLSFVCAELSKTEKGKVYFSAKSLIPKIYKRGFLDVSLFSFVAGIQKVLPTVPTSKAIQIYKSYFDMEEDELNDTTALSIIQRMKEEFYDKLKGG